jgi:DNA-directed RNA polymerase alpha subunit
MEWELLEYQNFGERSLLEVQNRLAVRGLYLGMDMDDEDIYSEDTE